MFEILPDRDLQFHHPFAMYVAGPSQSGKTEFTRKLIERLYLMVDKPIDKIIWFYGQYQKRFLDPIQSKTITFVEGIDYDLLNSIDGSQSTLIVIDDLMDEIGNNKQAGALFTRGVHHKNLSVIFILQNIYHKGNSMRSISLNSHYFVLFRNEGDLNQIVTFGRRICPNNSKFFLDSFNDATQEPYGHFLISVHPRTVKSAKFRSRIFEQISKIYKPSK